MSNINFFNNIHDIMVQSNHETDSVQDYYESFEDSISKIECWRSMVSINKKVYDAVCLLEAKKNQKWFLDKVKEIQFARYKYMDTTDLFYLASRTRVSKESSGVVSMRMYLKKMSDYLFFMDSLNEIHLQAEEKFADLSGFELIPPTEEELEKQRVQKEKHEKMQLVMCFLPEMFEGLYIVRNFKEFGDSILFDQKQAELDSVYTAAINKLENFELVYLDSKTLENTIRLMEVLKELMQIDLRLRRGLELDNMMGLGESRSKVFNLKSEMRNLKKELGDEFFKYD